MTEDLLRELISFIKSAAPEIWDMAYRQVYNLAIGNFFWAVCFLISFIILFRFFLSYKQKNDESDWDKYEIYVIIFLCGFILSLIMFLVLLNNTVGYLINPGWYAVKQIISLMPQ